MSRVTEAMPGLALVVSSKAFCRRPAMMTLLPRAWNASARPRPMPEPPPVIRMVLSNSFIGVVEQGGLGGAAHDESVFGCFHGPEERMYPVDTMLSTETYCNLFRGRVWCRQ